jgi:hypothetical protein
VSTPLPQPGDRIRLDYMPNDPDPIPPGSTGTVTDVGPEPYYNLHRQVYVDWDDKRSLILLHDIDQYTILQPLSALPSTERCPTCGQPDNCGDCEHAPMTDAELTRLGLYRG